MLGFPLIGFPLTQMDSRSFSHNTMKLESNLNTFMKSYTIHSAIFVELTTP